MGAGAAMGTNGGAMPGMTGRAMTGRLITGGGTTGMTGLATRGITTTGATGASKPAPHFLITRTALAIL